MHISIEDVDEPPVFESSHYFVEVSENVDIGTTIQIVAAKDPDATNNSVRWVTQCTFDLLHTYGIIALYVLIEKY